MRLVLHDAIKAATRRERTLPPSQPDVVDPADDPEHALLRAETAAAVWTAMGQLPPQQRAAVVQRYFLELSEREMATAAACRPSTIKWRLHGARDRLRGLLAPRLHDMEGL